MKKIALIAITFLLIACNEEPKDYVTFSGTITNKNSDTIKVRKRGFTKIIPVNADGTFNDTLKVESGMYSFYDGNESTSLFLKNGYDINMTIDTEQFDETAAYTGTGSENSNFLAKKALLEEKLLDQDFDGLDKAGLDNAMEDVKTQINEYIASAKDLDTMVINSSKKSVDGLIKSYKNYYNGIIALRQAIPAGSTSPTFENYENFAGGTTSLSDLKGKYVYVDVWATWCGPCKAEIPYLKEVEAAYHDKEIAFVSMSIDDDKSHKGSWEKAHESWKAMVADKELGGIQLYAPKGWKSEFVEEYKIKGIPRFILIDPDGNVINASAPRPSNPKLKEVLDGLI